MPTINRDVSNTPTNLLQNLDADTWYSVQLISPLGGAAHYILVDGDTFPADPPKRAHLLRNLDHVQIKGTATQSVWAWTGTEAVLAITEAANVKALNR